MLVAFDVDGTLLRGETICECLGRGIGKTEEMKVFESLTSRAQISEARRAMLEWFTPLGRDRLLSFMNTARLAPGSRAGFARLRGLRITTALVSISWRFAVDWLAAELGADHSIGTDWLYTGEVVDFWPDDKVTWLAALLRKQGLSPHALVAIGDSAGDMPMLAYAGRAYFVGPEMPVPLFRHVRHWPNANIEELVADIVEPVSVNRSGNLG
jgi:phosphoserine phosphatase